MKFSTRCLVPLVLALGAVGAVQAQTYQLSGTLGDEGAEAGPLNGGTFSGTFQFANPQIGDFDFKFFDSTGALYYELSDQNAFSTYTSNYYSRGFDELQFSSDLSGSPAYDLNLAVPLGFTGVGAVISHAASGGYSYTVMGAYSSAYANAVTSGMSVAAVPEPASWALMGFGVMGLLAYRRRSQSA